MSDYSTSYRKINNTSKIIILTDILIITLLHLYNIKIGLVIYIILSSIIALICYVSNSFMFQDYITKNKEKFREYATGGIFDIFNGGHSTSQIIAILSSNCSDAEFKDIKSHYKSIILYSYIHALITFLSVMSIIM